MEHGSATRQTTVPPEPGPAVSGRAAASHRSGRTSHRSGRPVRYSLPATWPLLVVLAVQAALTLRLVWADTAFQDEALYLWAGHLEWANVLHGTPLPQFSSFFSGSPVIYPPLAALADSVGGLAGARILSLVFMLGTTVALWSSADRLFGRRAAFFAAALFAFLGPSLHLGAFATYDAMALFLLALAAWMAVRAGDRQDATGLMLTAGFALALANATSYPTALFDPVVVLLALVTASPQPGGKLAAGRALTLLVVTATLVPGALLAGGSRYLHGVQVTTLLRAPGHDPALTVIGHFWSWTGVIVVAACCGAITSWVTRPNSAESWLLTLLTVAALLVPAEQAVLHTTASLNKHGAVGAWFAAAAAGYAVNRLIVAAPAGNARLVTGAASVIALCFPLSLGAGQSWAFSTNWPNASAFVAILRPLAEHETGRLLVEDPSLAEYYLPAGSQWKRWSSTRNIVLPSGAPTGGPSDAAGVVGPGNTGTFTMYIDQGYFSLVVLNFTDTTALDLVIAKHLHANRHYHIIDVIPYGPSPGTYVIWRYEPAS